MEFPDVHLKLEHVDSVPGEHYTVRTLRYNLVALNGIGLSWSCTGVSLTSIGLFVVLRSGRHY